MTHPRGIDTTGEGPAYALAKGRQIRRPVVWRARQYSGLPGGTKHLAGCYV